MSQCSSDVPIVVNFSICIFPGDLLLSRLYHLKYKISIEYNVIPMSETFKKSQLSEFFDVSAECNGYDS